MLPARQQYYPALPRLLFVLADTRERAARQRVRDLKADADGHPMVRRMPTGVNAGAARPADLEDPVRGLGPVVLPAGPARAMPGRAGPCRRRQLR
ncbi:hypothetical protein [Kitasatospora sp. NPDC005751]|uniref:hypothetical protein n=1 Tax=Kitasatospora sp. NPDC005751 TaxID=3157064 RepID=UPI0033D37E62